MLKHVAEIITAVGNNPKKMWTMVIILLFVSTVVIINKVLSKSDCAPLIKENVNLMKGQNELLDQNRLVMTRNAELLKGFLDIQKLIVDMKPDTVYITKIAECRLTKNDISVLYRADVATYSDEDTVVSANVQPKYVYLNPSFKTYKKRVKSNSDSILAKLNRIVEYNVNGK